VKASTIDSTAEEFCQIVARILVETAKNGAAQALPERKKKAKRLRRR
jgi:hypothetical protein